MEILIAVYEYIICSILLVLHVLYYDDLLHNLVSPGLSFGSVECMVLASVCVCVCVCVYVHTYVYMYVRAYVRMYVCK